jgi:hypothetical protein
MQLMGIASAFARWATVGKSLHRILRITELTNFVLLHYPCFAVSDKALLEISTVQPEWGAS